MGLRRKWRQDAQSISLLIEQVEYRINVKSVLKIMDILVIVILPVTPNSAASTVALHGFLWKPYLEA